MLDDGLLQFGMKQSQVPYHTLLNLLGYAIHNKVWNTSTMTPSSVGPSAMVGRRHLPLPLLYSRQSFELAVRRPCVSPQNDAGLDQCQFITVATNCVT